jgi:hypothetical protein
MKKLLATTAMSAVLALGVTAGAMAQAPSSATPARQPDGMASQTAPQMQQAEQALRQAQQKLSGSGQGDQQATLKQAREAVNQTQQVLGQVPAGMQGQDAYKKAQQQVSAAQSAMQGNQPDRQKVATQLKEAADAIASLHNDTGASASSAAGAAKGA